MSTDRDVWVPRYETRLIEYEGGGWPDVLVEKWEDNAIGERRYVTNRLYHPPVVAPVDSKWAAGEYPIQKFAQSLVPDFGDVEMRAGAAPDTTPRKAP